MVLAYALGAFFLSALLIKVEATSDDESDQKVFAALLIVCVFAGPCTIMITICTDVLLSNKKDQEKAMAIEDQNALHTKSSPPNPSTAPFDAK